MTWVCFSDRVTHAALRGQYLFEQTLQIPVAATPGEKVDVPWRSGNADSFQTGALEERRARSAQGSLPATIYKPAGAGPFPFVVLVLIGNADTATPVRFCEQMKAGQPASAPQLKLVVYPYGRHTFDMRLPDRTILGMRLGYDADAHADARRQVVDFLAEHGLIGKRP